MAMFLENVGLGSLKEDAFFGLMSMVAEQGKGIIGYSGLPYLNLHLGDVQIVARTEHREGENAFDIVGADTHVAGGLCN